MSKAWKGASAGCINSCSSIPSTEPMVPKSRHATVNSTSLLSEIHLTNHKSLPPLIHAFSDFIANNPQYTSTELADHIRDHDYYHLSKHVCFDYNGFGLFSRAQLSSKARFSHSQSSFFNITYKSVTLKSQLWYGNQETTLESAINRRVMDFLKISDEEYTMVCTANKTSSFRILAESYPFQSNKKLLTVYDHESEAVRTMVEIAKRRGARDASAEFCWPSMKIHSGKLKQIVSTRNQKGGLFVFSPQSQMTGTKYAYQWMSLAQKNGWHVVLDACSLGPKDMNTLGLSLIKPDFIVCSFFKIFGEDPSGFSGLLIKRSSRAILEKTTANRSIGIISIIPQKRLSTLALRPDNFVTNMETQPSNTYVKSLFSYPRPAQSSQILKLKDKVIESYDVMNDEKEAFGEPSSRIMCSQKSETNDVIECRYLDHADSVGLHLISRRVSCLTDWLVNALLKLKHPLTGNGEPLVRIYGSQQKFTRGPALAINLFDWKGQKIEPRLVQKLADRSNISISCGLLRNICFLDRYEEDKSVIWGKRLHKPTTNEQERTDLGITVVNVTLNFLNNFEDTYRLWSFIAKFLDADFIEKERWRYIALNQTMIEF
ncbi:uncharacterized protein A4U43_C10F12090 [Asparagus officinalis]|uniref:Aminotransferase class V domain-containing protein n=1 Tax=Asparagus officinalis TaxID=4686 RepID=A0A5P1E413_ASPOF|nr:molybdenum cofactor sulfurase-like [Asparagus officinalis]ONK56723.1 uncharacterized protein A4U43_C10F12090 [Asparagus officinalis]